METRCAARRKPRPWLVRFLLALTDLYGFALIIYFALRLSWGDRLGAVALISVFLSWLLLPSLVFLLVALFLRRWPTAALQGVSVVAFLWLYGGLFLPQPVPPGANSLTVMTYNAAANSHWITPGALAPMIRASHVDLVALTEVAPQQAQEVEELRDLYPYQVVYGLGIPGKALLSRYPILDHEVFYLQSHRLPYLRATVLLTDTAGIPLAVTIVVAHPPPPLYGAFSFHIREDATAEISALAEMAADRRPAIFLGDFNLVDQSDNYRLLTRAGLTDAFRAAGWGLGATWPIRGRPFPGPLLRLDYVWVTGPFAVSRARVGADGGSDHLPMMAELRW